MLSAFCRQYSGSCLPSSSATTLATIKNIYTGCKLATTAFYVSPVEMQWYFTSAPQLKAAVDGITATCSASTPANTIIKQAVAVTSVELAAVRSAHEPRSYA